MEIEWFSVVTVYSSTPFKPKTARRYISALSIFQASFQSKDTLLLQHDLTSPDKLSVKQIT